MYRKSLLLAFLVVGGLMCLSPHLCAAPGVPATRREPVTEMVHGTPILDPYRWLEDQDSPDTRAWLNKQIEYTTEYLHKLPGREAMTQRLSQLMKVDITGLPHERGGRYFFNRRKADQNQAVIYFRQGLTGKDEALVDGNTLSKDQTSSAGLLDVSDDGKLMVYSIRQGGEDEVTLRFLNVDTRQHLTETLPRARYMGVALTPDKKTLFYARFTQEGTRIYEHPMGADPRQDADVFGKGYGPMQLISVHVSDDGHYAWALVGHGVPAKREEVFVRDLRQPGSAFRPVITGIDARFSVIPYQDSLYVRTDWKAPRERVLRIDLKNPDPAKWKEILPQSDAILQDFSLIGGRLVVDSLDKVITRTRVYDLDGKYQREFSYPTLGSSTGTVGREGSSEAFLQFSSFAYPQTVYRFDVATGKQEIFSRTEVPFNSDSIEVKQVWYESKDKTRVPMFLAYRKGLKLDGTAPVYLTAYGGFNVSRTPAFAAKAAYWIEQGGVWALPNLRGGGEFGEEWHHAGMFEKKQNVFDDFLGAAEWLIANRYTSPKHLAISGGSNGGLLVGAALTQRPDLFQAVICSVPLLDMVRYHKFKVGHWWTAEYGSPDDPQQFSYIYQYSPYHHVRPGTAYPAVMFITGDSDTRVDPLHARKMTALLQSVSDGGKPVLLHYDTKGGHTAGQPVSKQVEDAVDELSFLLSLTK